MGKQGSFTKRCTDIFFSILTLIITFPFLLIAVVAIKLESKGPAFFIHERAGYKGKPFRMVKLRGMVDNALTMGPELTQPNDSRITKVGKILRRTSLDEIPQVINVLKGEMSIVGPRPEVISLASRYDEKQKQVFNYKPGITGISQINGRQMLTPEQRVEMEINYYQSTNFWKDFMVAIKTFRVVFSNDGNL